MTLQKDEVEDGKSSIYFVPSEGRREGGGNKDGEIMSLTGDPTDMTGDATVIDNNGN